MTDWPLTGAACVVGEKDWASDAACLDRVQFVDVLARDTVAPAAMGKRGLQSQEAMGVAALDSSFLGHHKAVKSVGSIND